MFACASAPVDVNNIDPNPLSYERAEQWRNVSNIPSIQTVRRCGVYGTCLNRPRGLEKYVTVSMPKWCGRSRNNIQLRVRTQKTTNETEVEISGENGEKKPVPKTLVLHQGGGSRPRSTREQTEPIHHR
ncbi:hypothetical protein PAAG_11768 [Paracoccidioides lutzii Pb01]|uniref:Uncharacterized protein n=1 Tax=Paracoccidioides lutzii (strain ATCC MYA-826 / Pb01) TaxID=502779 RepID=A0A0A2V145_PARBA|nr:hypothetical protein PAAG_11768 [Paracoccidioides lutzii Pb01]KGQ01531.1 hypothetical protein PAAG_11768 [Paracoccidioides lutzii Pb01]